MTQEEKIELLAELFEVEPAAIKPETSLSDLTWDSMTQLGLIALFRGEFSQKLEAAKIRTFKTVGDILAEMP